MGSTGRDNERGLSGGQGKGGNGGGLTAFPKRRIRNYVVTIWFIGGEGELFKKGADVSPRGAPR